WIGENGHLGLAINRLDNRYGLPPGAHDHAHAHEEHEEEESGIHVPGDEFVFIDMERTRYDLDAELRNLADWAERIQYRLSYTDYAHAEIEGNGDIGTRYSNDAWQQRLQITHTDTARRHGVLGLQYSSEEFA